MEALRKRDDVRVASVAVLKDGKYLFGKRRDNGKWTMPSGHLMAGEDPAAGASRELREETGLDVKPDSLEVLGHEKVPGRELVVYSYRCSCSGTPDASKDPDQEFSEFSWFSPDDIPADSSLHVPRSRNVTIRLLAPELSKSVPPHLQNTHIFGGGRWGAMSGEAPKFPAQSEPSHENLVQTLKGMGIKHHETSGQYEVPERSVLMYDPSREQMQELGKRFGQESVVYSDGGNHELIYTNGPFDGKSRLIEPGKPPIEHFPEAPSDMYTKHPQEGYFRINFDFTKDPEHRGPDPEPMKKSLTPYWKSRDGLRIPKLGTAEREQWDQGFRDRVGDVFAGGDQKRLKKIRLPVEAASGFNMPVNKDRLRLYRRMGAAEGKLPPVVVRRNGAGYDLVDGNHRQAAARAAGHTHLEALEILPQVPMRKSSFGIKEAGFRHKGTGAVTGSGVCHDINELPQGADPGDYEDGFVGDDGSFMTRTEAAARVHQPEPLQSEDLEKAVDPKDFSSILKATSQAGRDLVDHGPDLSAHPQAIAPAVAEYQGILDSPKTHKRAKTKLGGGITKKVVYQSPVQAPDQEKPTRFMVKPYHEGIIKRIQNWQRYPIQGWAEMTNQALYHAAGIGDLHQKVHVAEHDMETNARREKDWKAADDEPALVVHLQNEYAPSHVVSADETQDPSAVRKIAAMDFLTNNLDRHGGNIMFHEETGKPLALDHSRSFQYSNTMAGRDRGRTRAEVDRASRRGDTEGDRFWNYVSGSALRFHDNTLPQYNDYDSKMNTLQAWQPIFEEWWPKHRDEVVKTLEGRLGQIRDPNVQAHIRRNFMSRVKFMDERAHFGLDNFGTDWYNDEAPWYMPGQVSDEEVEAQEKAKAVAQGQAEEAARRGQR